MNKPVKILHISDLHFRHNGRLYYSTTKKINNGFIINNYSVLHISDRDIQKERKNLFDIGSRRYLNYKIIENIKRGGKIILNRDDKFFDFLFQKAKSNNLEIITFGKHRESHILLKKIIEKNGNSKIFVKIDAQNLVYEFRDINIYNVLAGLAVFHELKIDLKKIKFTQIVN